MRDDGRDVLVIFGRLSFSTGMILLIGFVEDDLGDAFEFGTDT